MQNTPNILIVIALPMENVGNQLDAFGEIIYTGIGKVNAALHLTERLSQAVAGQAKRPDLVINLGSAGAQQRPTGSILACTRFVQRDLKFITDGADGQAGNDWQEALA